MKNSRLKYKLIAYSMVLSIILPLLLIIIWSFANRWQWPSLVPTDYGIRGWSYIFGARAKTFEIICISMCISFMASIITVGITIPAAKAMAHYNFRLKKQIEMLIFLPAIVPTVVVAMGIHIHFLRMNLGGSFSGLVLINILPCIPYSYWILKNVFEIIGDKMNYQARVLGASSTQTFIYITLPMIFPGIITALSMSFIVSFGQYFINVLIGAGKITTFTMLMFPYIESGDRTMGSVYGTVFLFASLIGLVIVEKLTSSMYRGKLKEYKYV